MAMQFEEFVGSTNVAELTMLISAAAHALRKGVDPAAVADRIQSALNAGYGHVPYNADALHADVEDLA